MSGRAHGDRNLSHPFPDRGLATVAGRAATPHDGAGMEPEGGFMKTGSGLFAAALAAFASLPASGFDFEPPVARPAGENPQVVAVGDVNGDRLDDVVVAYSVYLDGAATHTVLVFLQSQDGELSDPTEFNYASANTRVDIALADLDHDGTNEILACHEEGLSIFSNAGSGSFDVRAAAPVPPATECTFLASMDVDQDGHRDVIAQSWAVGAGIYYGDGHGGIRSTGFIEAGGGGSGSFASGDVTGDGLDDLIQLSQTSPEFHVYPINPEGGFGARLAYPTPPSIWSIGGFTAGDYNGDGRQDLAVSISANRPESSIWIYAQEASGTLGTAVQLPSYDIPTNILATDLDRDGRTDLLVGHSAWTAIGRYMQGNAGLEGEVLSDTVFNSRNGRMLAVGDIDDDGCTDSTNVDRFSGLIVLKGKDCLPRVAKSDYNGDGYSDLFWREEANGQNVIWSAARYESQWAVTAVTNLAWKMVGNGDFNGDGKADALWHNTDTGASVVWWSGSFGQQKALTRITNRAWTIAGTGDFDGDGNDDLLWRNRTTGANVIWRSGNFGDQMAVKPVSSQQWVVAGIDDFNGDGRDDLLWHHDGTGANVIWRSARLSDSQAMTDVTNLTWRIVGTGDFDGDGMADVLWRHDVTGANLVWRKASYAARMPVARLADRHWKVAAIGDYDGNGKSDIVWRHASTGQNMIWRAAAVSVPRPVRDVIKLNWNIKP